MSEGRPLAIADHGLIGDGYSAALVGVDGSVDWCCFPRFDSPSVFGRLLDWEKGGFLQVAPAADRFESLQAYDSSTNVLQTLFRAPDAASVVLTDFMPWTGDPPDPHHEILRFVEARDGRTDMRIVFDPRLDYGRGETRIEIGEHGATAIGPNGEHLSVSVSPGIRFATRDAGGVEARVHVRSGQRFWVAASWRSKRPEPIAAFRPFEHLRRTRRFWRNWAAGMTYDGPWRHDVERAALTLKLLQYAPTGAMVAAPTTSLPEWPAGDRNWDYRFSWTRDSAMALRAMNLIGYEREALGFFQFVRDCVDRRGSLDIMVTLDGEDVPDETILDHLHGYDGGVVRVGNAAAHQVQYDIVGPLLDAAYLYERVGGVASLRLWREIRHLVDRAVDTMGEPDHGIWEPRHAPTHHVHSKLMTWVALDRALSIAPLFGGDREESRWRIARAHLKNEILTRGYNEERGTFVGDYDGEHLDATLLLMPIHGFIGPRDPRVLRTLDRIQKELGEGRFIRRYKTTDGLDGEEGGFVLCGFWLAEALALAGRLDEALDVFHAQSAAANHLGLLAEEVDTMTGGALGNFPQAFSHLGLIQAAARLDLALKLRDEGDDQPPRHPFDAPDPEA